jgi:geranylgeranyl diphosphate synthase type I
MMELERVKDLVEAELYRLRAGMTFPLELYDSAFHLPLSGGKRLRPFLVIESAKIWGAEEEMALPPAIAVELLHSFTLIHDDVMDNDAFRRGVSTTHVIWGVPMAINAGDALFSLLFSYLVGEMKKLHYDSGEIVRAVEILAESALRISEGQVMDVLAERYIASEDRYLEMISKKTASLFEASCLLGGLVGGASEEEKAYLRGFGLNAGITFQLIDDILGMVGDPQVTGKPAGSDIRRGKRTLIVVRALEEASREERAEILSILGRDDASEEEVKRVERLMIGLGALDYSKAVAEKYLEKALEFLSRLPDNPPRRILEATLRLLYEREK